MINFNGDLLPEDALFLNTRNAGFRYGDVLLEDIRFFGSRLILWEQHYFRIMAAMRQLRMEIPMSFTMEFLEGQLWYTIKASQLPQNCGQVRLSLFRNLFTEKVGEGVQIHFVVEVIPLQDASYIHDYSECKADIFKDYHIHADQLSGLPLPGGAIRTLAAIYAKENDLDTLVFLNHKKEVCETLQGSIFIRFDNHIIAPPDESGCQLTVLRTHLIQLLSKDSEFTFEYRVVSPFDLQQAHEIFSLDEHCGFRSITRFRKTTYSTESAQLLVKRLNASLPVKD